MKLRPVAAAIENVKPAKPVVVKKSAVQINRDAMNENERVMRELLPRIGTPMLVAEMQKCVESKTGSPNGRLERILLEEAVKRIVDLGVQHRMATMPEHVNRMCRIELRRKIIAGELTPLQAFTQYAAETEGFLQGLMFEHPMDGVRYWKHSESGLSYATAPGDELQGECLSEFVEIGRKDAIQTELF